MQGELIFTQSKFIFIRRKEYSFYVSEIIFKTFNDTYERNKQHQSSFKTLTYVVASA